MIEAPVLENEVDRLNDLYSLNLLDTLKEERFDRLIRLAKRALKVDMCYLALVGEDRQWLKSKCGIPLDQSERDISFCGHAIAQHELMEVQDALRDERFWDNPLVVADPHIRFYAGFPLKGPNGHNVGTFCIADSTPRQLTDDERFTLIEYAKLAERELNMLDVLKTQNELLEAQQELKRVRRNLERELAEAADFVHQKLPRRFNNEHLKLDWEFIESSQLGGDMFGFEPLGERQFLVYLLDVAGHGIGASLLAISVQNSLRQMLKEMRGAISPATVLQQLNASFQMESNQNRFFTMWCGVIDQSSRSIYFANGGHHFPVLFDEAYHSVALGHDSMMIGISPEASFEDEEFQYSPRSRLVLFSDGIVEELDHQQRQFGLDRLKEAYRTRCSTSACELSSIIDRVRQWNGNRPFADDVSLMELTLKK